ncbi:hypothetical protein F4804DRAFT_332493 [Jackrogersella minutella]|nr:hypothetical protein F4804DRAFT_332493 [Jackrogersella minutella]
MAASSEIQQDMYLEDVLLLSLRRSSLNEEEAETTTGGTQGTEKDGDACEHLVHGVLFESIWEKRNEELADLHANTIQEHEVECPKKGKSYTQDLANRVSRLKPDVSDKIQRLMTAKIRSTNVTPYR